MKAVVVLEHGVVELNWMWLPTWIGMNTNLKAELEKYLAEKIKDYMGMKLDNTLVDRLHLLVLDFLDKKYPQINGLRSYIEQLKLIEL